MNKIKYIESYKNGTYKFTNADILRYEKFKNHEVICEVIKKMGGEMITGNQYEVISNIIYDLDCGIVFTMELFELTIEFLDKSLLNERNLKHPISDSNLLHKDWKRGYKYWNGAFHPSYLAFNNWWVTADALGYDITKLYRVQSETSRPKSQRNLE